MKDVADMVAVPLPLHLFPFAPHAAPEATAYAPVCSPWLPAAVRGGNCLMGLRKVQTKCAKN
jgi:hypothetical protein